ncbi:MAG: helix-turn-helix transcriptional regulator [Nitrospirota bacterium]
MSKRVIGGMAVEKSSGNVYADLELSDADEMLAKSRIVAEIGRIITARNVTQAQAAECMGINQPKVSALFRGHFEGYSQERLIGLLNKLGRDVEIVIKPARRGQQTGRLSVVCA